MAEKGARARLEPIAFRMYAEGQSLTAIEETLGVSRQTLSDWKARTRRSGEELDEWDAAREKKRGFDHRLEEIRENLITEIENTVGVKNVPPALFDSLAKVDALLDRNRRAAREAAEAIARQKGEMFLAVVRDLIDYGRRNAPELVSALEDNFDDLIQYGREKYATT